MYPMIIMEIPIGSETWDLDLVEDDTVVSFHHLGFLG